VPEALSLDDEEQAANSVNAMHAAARLRHRVSSIKKPITQF
jgi:hypothetical protein